jgi:hypothetical protein
VANLTGSAVKTSVSLTAKGAFAGVKIGAGIGADKLDEAADEVSDRQIKESGKQVGDSMFKKVVRHLQQATDALKKIEGKGYALEDCDGALEFGGDVGEFIWHLGKSIRYLDHAMKLVDHMAHGVEQWAALEGELWVAIEAVSLDFLSNRCGSCACHDKRLGSMSFKSCYGPGVQAAVPRRRM